MERNQYLQLLSCVVYSDSIAVYPSVLYAFLTCLHYWSSEFKNYLFSIYRESKQP